MIQNNLKNNLKNDLIKFFQSNYNIEQPYKVNNREFDFYGHFDQRNSKYFATQKLEYYAYSIYDHLFFKNISRVTEDFLDDIYQLTENIADTYSKIDSEHMETSITYLIQSDEPVSKEVQKFIKARMNFIKNYSFGLKGWTKLKLIIMVPTSNEVYVNKFGNRDKKSFQKILTNILNS